MHLGMSSTASPPQSSQDQDTHRTHEQPSISSLKTFVGLQKIVPDTDGCEKGPGRPARSSGREPFNDTSSRTPSNICLRTFVFKKTVISKARYKLSAQRAMPEEDIARELYKARMARVLGVGVPRAPIPGCRPPSVTLGPTWFKLSSCG